MFKKMFSTMTLQSAKHLRGYNPFVEFKLDINRTLDKHIQMNNNIMILGFGALGTGIIVLYKKTELDKKELDNKIDTNKIELNKRIDHLDKRINHLDKRMDRIEIRIDHIETRIDNIDQKLTEVLSLMNARKGWFWW